MPLGSAGPALVMMKPSWLSPSCMASLGFMSWLELHVEHLVTPPPGLVGKQRRWRETATEGCSQRSSTS